MSSSSKGKEREKPIASLIAGASGGAIESFVTFPFESVKTQLQFGATINGKASPWRHSSCPRPPFITHGYADA